MSVGHKAGPGFLAVSFQMTGAIAVLAIAFLSVCLSVTRRYYVKTNERRPICRLHWRYSAMYLVLAIQCSSTFARETTAYITRLCMLLENVQQRHYNWDRGMSQRRFLTSKSLVALLCSFKPAQIVQLTPCQGSRSSSEAGPLVI